jgi:hypothetical protein
LKAPGFAGGWLLIELLGAQAGQFLQQTFELRNAHEQFSSVIRKNSTKSIRNANRANYVQFTGLAVFCVA